MRDDAGSDPSARDAARGVIGLSAFANNRKGDARSADTCAERRRSIRRRQSRDHTNETKKIFTQFPTAFSIGESARRDVAARDVENPPPTSSSSRTNKHRKTRGKTKRVRLSPRRRRTHVIRRSRRSFRRLRLGVVVRRVGSLRGRIRVRGRRASRRASSPGHPRASHSRAVRSVLPPVRPFPSVRAFSDCPNDDVKKKNASRTFDT